MIDDAERFESALDCREDRSVLLALPLPLREMVDLAVEVGDALSAPMLTDAERDRIYAASLRGATRVWGWLGGGDPRARLRDLGRRPVGLLGAADPRQLLRSLSGRQIAMLGGAAAVAAVAAAIGVRVIVVRRGSRVHLVTA